MAVTLTAAAGPVPGTRKLYDYRTAVQLQDDFVSGGNTSGTIGALGWHFSGGAYAIQSSEAGAPGIGRRSTSASSGVTAYFFLNNSKQDMFTAGSMNVLWRGRLNTNDVNTTVRIGAAYLLNTTPTDGQYFEKLDADTNWFAVARAASVQTGTRTDTGVAVDTSLHTFRVIRTASAVIRYEIDGIVVATHIANIPSQALTPGYQIINSTTADKTFDHDYFEMEYEVSR